MVLSAPVLERWRVLIKGMEDEYGLKITKNDFYSKLKGVLDTRSAVRNPDVSNLKVKKLKVVNKELAERNIREGKLRIEQRRKRQPGSGEDSEEEYLCRGCLQRPQQQIGGGQPSWQKDEGSNDGKLVNKLKAEVGGL